MDIKSEKNRIREYVWKLLTEKNVALFPKPVYGRIPNFIGAEKAAERIFGLKEWMRAEVVKVNPDSPQKHVRYRGLVEGKKVIMATPRLLHGFLLLDPKTIPRDKYNYASTIRGAFIYGKKIRLEEIPRIDLVVTGSVAVDLSGARLGKGGGYAELEYGILRELGVVDDNVAVFTTVHDLQIVDKIPVEKHDLRVDFIATPTRLIRIEPRPEKPKGIYWEILGDKAELSVFIELKRLKSR